MSPIRLIDQFDVQRGIVSTSEALHLAREAGLDLVEVSPHEKPPVCRIIDWGKHKYDQRKRQKKQHSHDTVLKEVRIRPKTDDNDRMIKVKRAKAFLENGHKVQFTMLFRGRERTHSDIAMDIFNGIVTQIGELGRVERAARMDGRRMTMVLTPARK